MVSKISNASNKPPQKKIISHKNIFLRRTVRIFKKSLVKSVTLLIKHYTQLHNFWKSLDRWNRKKIPKMLKKKNEIVKDGILLKFWISNISGFFEKKNHSFSEFL